MKIEKFNFLSSNKTNKIYGKIYIPSENINVKGIVQIVHGMCEYFDRYKVFIEFLVNNGYIVCGHDHLGHGQSVDTKDDFGFFAEKYGYKCLIKDTYSVTKLIKERYPNKKIIILGHSMGSFIVRGYLYDYSDMINGVILSGTIGPIKTIDLAIKFMNVIIKKYGSRFRSQELMDLAFNISNVKIKHAISKYSWVTRNVSIIEKYEKDSLGNFAFTASGYKDLFQLVKLANNEEYIKKINKKLPIFIFSGQNDPIGENGKGVERAYKVLLKNKCRVDMKIYTNGRHEMLTEVNNRKVFNDIITWIERMNLYV